MRVVFDLETSSEVDLRAAGAAAYAEHPSTVITVFAWALDRGPVRVLKVPFCCTDAREFQLAVMRGATVIAHNYSFELSVYNAKLVPKGWPEISHRQWTCTMARALAAGYPARLELAALAANLKAQKDKLGHALMLRMARPRGTDARGDPVWWHETDRAKLDQLADYCRQDVEVERELDRVLPELPPVEQDVFLADLHMNQRGLRIDQALVSRMQVLTRAEKQRVNARLAHVTQGCVTSGSQVARIMEVLEQSAVPITSLRRPEVAAALRRNDLSPVAREVLQGRLDTARASTAKLTAMEAGVCADGRLRGGFQYYGANRTGRWAGRRVQPQNFFRGTIKDVSGAIGMIESGCDAEGLDLLFEDTPMGVIASCLRGTIEAAPGHALVAADLSQIEARVVAWIAGQQDVLDVFASGEDVYTYTAKQIGSPSRQLGKVLVLACGFGMSHMTFQTTALGYGITLTETEAEDAVRGWRELNHRIVRYWWESYKAALRIAAARPGASETWGNVTYHRAGDRLELELPSGRRLIYREPEVVSHPQHGHNELTYMGLLSGNWTRLRSWPGKLTENIVQAVARDVMAEAMVRMDHKGVPLIATIHDELVAEIEQRRADKLLAFMLATMRRRPAWARDLPVDAAGFVGTRYRKG